MDLLSNISESLPEELSSNLDTDEFSTDNLGSLIELTDQFLTGLVPIVGEVKNYGIVESDSDLYIAEKHILNDNDIEYQSVSIAGFVKEEEFWQDSSRFLFDEKEYTVYCRIDDTRLKDDWIPLKLMEVVDSLSRGTTDSVQNLSEAFDLESEVNTRSSRNISRGLVRDDIELYLELMPVDVDDELASDIIDKIPDQVDSASIDAEERESFLNEAYEMVKEKQPIEIDNTTHIRVIGEVLSQNSANSNLDYTDTETDWFLEVNFISIYW